MKYETGKWNENASVLHVIELSNGAMKKWAICGTPQFSSNEEWLTGNSLTGDEAMCNQCTADILQFIRAGGDLIHAQNEGADHDLR